MATSDLTIKADHFDSLEQLYVNVVIARGETELYQKIFNGTDEAAFTQLTGEVARAVDLPVSDVEQALVAPVQEARKWWAERRTTSQSTYGFQGSLISSADLDKLTAQHRWLIKNVLVRDQPVLWGGPKKSLKTSVMIDAALSIGSGRPFLGKFEVPEKLRVAVLSGESGQITIRDTARRIAAARGLSLAACNVMWGFELPGLGVEEELALLEAALRENEIDVVFVDPVYLCLSAGVSIDVKSMFDVGPLFRRVAFICQETKTTLILVHHTTKPGGMQKRPGEMLDLEDLAYAGFQEFARQWLLINRRETYEPGSGKHLLWMNFGGSAGQSGSWGLDINEGKLGEDFGGRRWQVNVRTMDDALKTQSEEKDRKKAGIADAKKLEQRERLLKALALVPEGETQAQLAKMTGIQPRTVGPLLLDLLEDKRVRRIGVRKASGQGEREYDGWQLVTEKELMVTRIENYAKARRAKKVALPLNIDDDDTDFLDDIEASMGADSLNGDGVS